MIDDPARPPRFPYVAALLCAACVGAAGWTWMRYSYCWDMTVGEIVKTQPGTPSNVTGRLVRFHGTVLYEVPNPPLLPFMELLRNNVPAVRVPHPQISESPRARLLRKKWAWWVIGDLVHPDTEITVLVRGTEVLPIEEEVTTVGRVTLNPDVVIDTAFTRFHPASIAGLVVGAMGVFVFAVALRHWLGERRAARGAA